MEQDDIEEVEVDSKQIEIIDYINDRLLQNEIEAKRELKILVEQKFGSEGLTVWNLLENEDEDTPFDMEECEDCGDLTEEWLEQTKKKMDQFAIFIDDKFDDIVNSIIDDNSGSHITDTIIRESIVENITTDENEILDLMKLIKNKILFTGIVNGWLADEYFIKVSD